ncbi:MAG: NosD domain-containing protein [Candidatus Woesearchaeota archaeon]
MKWAIVFLLLVPGVLACVVPRDGMRIAASVQLCTDVYYLEKGISIVGSDVKVDCNGAVLKSWNGGKGVSVEHVSNVTISKCRLVNYDIGLYVRNSSMVHLEDNHLVKNKIGTRFTVVRDSATFNHDVSLVSPFEVFESENNILSLTNKFVSGDFCSINFCNQGRNAISLFIRPKTTSREMQNWLIGQLTGRKSAQKLHEWVFGDFKKTKLFS